MYIYLESTYIFRANSQQIIMQKSGQPQKYVYVHCGHQRQRPATLFHLVFGKICKSGT